MNNYQQLATTLLNGLNNPYTQKRQIVSVNGIHDARAYALDRGESVILMDANDDIIYIKTCDDTGKCAVKVYSCTDITETAVDESSDISRSDFNKLSDEVAELKSMLKGVIGEHHANRQQSFKKPTEQV